MTDLLCSVPAELSEIWYVYDLILLVIIALCIVVLSFLKKRTNVQEGERAYKSAKNTLKKASDAAMRRKKLLLYSAKNILSSAEYSYSLCLNEEDMYSLSQRLDAIAEAKKAIGTLYENFGGLAEKEINEKIEEICKLLD